MNRRTFLAGALASSAAAVGSVPAIDTHTHFYDPSRPQGVPWPGKQDKVLYRTVMPAEFTRVAAPFAVAGTVVVEASPWVEDNQWILDMAKKEESIVALIGNLKAGESGFARNLARFARNPLFRGIRQGSVAVSAGAGDRAFLEDMKRMGDLGMTLDVLGGVDMLPSVARLADAVPSLTIVIDHLPFEPLPDTGDYDRMLKELGARKRVYAKVSNVLRRVDGRVVTDLEVYRPRLDKLWNAFGEDRLVYGSNWPVSDLVGTYSELHAVVAAYFGGKGHTAAEKYFWRNSLAAYRWVNRGQQPR